MIDKNSIRECIDALYSTNNTLSKEEPASCEFVEQVDIDIAIESIKVAIRKLESVSNSNPKLKKFFPIFPNSNQKGI